MIKWPTLLITIFITIISFNIVHAVDHELYLPSFGVDQLYSPSNQPVDLQLNTFFTLYQEIIEPTPPLTTHSGGGSYTTEYNVTLKLNKKTVMVGDNITATITVQNLNDIVGTKVLVSYFATQEKQPYKKFGETSATIQNVPPKKSGLSECRYYGGTYNSLSKTCAIIFVKDIAIPDLNASIGNWTFTLDYYVEPYPYKIEILQKHYEVTEKIKIDKLEEFFNEEGIDDELKTFIRTVWQQIQYYYNVTKQFIETELLQ